MYLFDIKKSLIWFNYCFFNEQIIEQIFIYCKYLLTISTIQRNMC